jgi:hypothetical protein
MDSRFLHSEFGMDLTDGIETFDTSSIPTQDPTFGNFGADDFGIGTVIPAAGAPGAVHFDASRLVAPAGGLAAGGLALAAGAGGPVAAGLGALTAGVLWIRKHGLPIYGG